MERAGGLVVAELLVVLAEVGVVAGVGAAHGEVWLGGPALRRTVRVAPAPTPGQLRDLLLTAPQPGVVVADRLPARHRHVLDDAGWGWWDRRGALSVRVGERHVRREPAAVPVPDTALPAPLERPTGRMVALHLLEAPANVPSVRRLAGATSTSTGAVGRVLTELRELGLVADRRVVDPDALLAAVAAAWRPRWHVLPSGAVPSGSAQERHVLGLDGRDGGWCRVGVPAALALGAPGPPSGASAAAPVAHVLVPDERALAWLLRRAGSGAEPAGGQSHDSHRGAQVLVAVAPRPRKDDGAHAGSTTTAFDLPVAPAVEVAVSLAADPTGVGRDLLDAWRGAGWPLSW